MTFVSLTIFNLLSGDRIGNRSVRQDPVELPHVLVTLLLSTLLSYLP